MEDHENTTDEEFLKLVNQTAVGWKRKKPPPFGVSKWVFLGVQKGYEGKYTLWIVGSNCRRSVW